MKKIILMAFALFPLQFLFAQSDGLLEKYRTMALEYNHDLKAAQKSISASLELEKSVKADRKPKLDGGAKFRYTGNPTELEVNLPGASAPLSFKGQNMAYGTSVSLLQPLYTGGQILESIRLAEHRQALAEEQEALIRTAVCYQTDIQYWNTVARLEIVGIMSDFRNSMDSLVLTIRERVETGLTDPQDLLMAEVNLNEASYQLLKAKSDFETSRMALNSIIGMELKAPTPTEGSISQVAVADSLFQMVPVSRPEIRMAQEKIKIAESSLRLNDAQYKPKLYIGAEGSYSSPGYNFRSDIDPNYAVYASLSLPIFEWGKRRYEKRASAEEVGIANDQFNRVEDEVRLEIETARLALSQALERVSLSESSLGKALSNENKALERYHEGKISLLEVIDAQIYRQTSQINHVEAKVAAQDHYSALLKALNVY